jgi:hypothetical protein
MQNIIEANPYLGLSEHEVPELESLPAGCFEEFPEQTKEFCEVVVRHADGHVLPVQEQACPLCKDMAHYGIEPICKMQSEGLCCSEFRGMTDRGTVQCAAVHASIAQDPPMVALVALQKREKMPPPLQ